MSAAPTKAAEAPAAKPWAPSFLTRMLLLCDREADRIEIFQTTREGPGIEVPRSRWDAEQRSEHDLYKRLGELVHIVMLVEGDFRRLVKQKLGDSLKRTPRHVPEVDADAIADQPKID